MLRFDHCILALATISILGGCSLPSSSTSQDEEVGAVTEELSQPNRAVKPPGSQPSAELAVPAAVSIDPRAAKDALRGDVNLRGKLRGLAIAEAARHGVANPAAIHAVAASDHSAAEAALSGALVDDHVPVYVVRMTGGRFTAQHHPREVAAPEGNVLTVTVDAATNRITDIGIVNEEPDLNQLGDTTVDLTAP
jgi:hypothetical protein